MPFALLHALLIKHVDINMEYCLHADDYENRK